MKLYAAALYSQGDATIGYIKLNLSISIWFYIIAVVLFAFIAWKHKRITTAALISYMFLLFAATVLNRTSRAYSDFDLTLLRLFRQENWREDKDGIEQVFDNIIMFIPISLLMSNTLGCKWLTVFFGFLFSCFLEGCQFILRRGLCEIDDVISNMLGAIIGCVVYLLIKGRG